MDFHCTIQFLKPSVVINLFCLQCLFVSVFFLFEFFLNILQYYISLFPFHIAFEVMDLLLLLLLISLTEQKDKKTAVKREKRMLKNPDIHKEPI